MAQYLSRVEREDLAREKLIWAGTCRGIAAGLAEAAARATIEKYAMKLELGAARLHPSVTLDGGAA
jgi:hypothetical protein